MYEANDILLEPIIFDACTNQLIPLNFVQTSRHCWQNPDACAIPAGCLRWNKLE